MNPRLVTGLFIAVGVILAVVNFSLYSRLDSNSINGLLTSLKTTSSQQKATLLPDIKAGKSYSSSPSRSDEINKVKDYLPYVDSGKDFTIELNDKTKDVTVSIPTAKDMVDFRTKKLAAELKLRELGSDNPCLLLILWSAPLSLQDKLTKSDSVTSGCKN